MIWSQEKDEWRWNLDDSGAFTVKSAYTKLEMLLLEDVWGVEEKGVFANLWKSLALQK